MSSFKEQLYQAGLISKKQLRKLNQDEKMDRKRGNGEEEGLVMQNVASMLTIEEIQAVANYVSGLY